MANRFKARLRKRNFIMSQIRAIRPNEIALLHLLLHKLDLDPANFPLPENVDEYEGGKMGSISLGTGAHEYDGDLIQVEYIDTDGTPVVITLTKDTKGQLLDLDFWKTDFSKLLDYPSVDQIIFK